MHASKMAMATAFVLMLEYLYIIIQWFFNENQAPVVIANDTQPSGKTNG